MSAATFGASDALVNAGGPLAEELRVGSQAGYPNPDRRAAVLAEAVALVGRFDPDTVVTDVRERLSMMREIGSLMKRHDVQVPDLTALIDGLSEPLADRGENAKKLIVSVFDSVVLGEPVGVTFWAKANADYEQANSAREDEDCERGDAEPVEPAEEKSNEPGPQKKAILDFAPSKIVSFDTLRKEGQHIIAAGVPYVWDGIIPAYGMVGFLVAGAKVGKSTLGISLASAISRAKDGDGFLGHAINRRKVLYLALEDPREYLAVLAARAARGGEDALFYPGSIVLDDRTLDALAEYIKQEGIGFVYVATFLNGVRGLVKDENDNAGMVVTVNRLKFFARKCDIPILLEAHAGKGEDRSDDADPVKALRGASAAAGEADFLLSLRRKGGGFSTLRTLAGLGRFVDFPPITFDYDRSGGELTVVSSDGSAGAEKDWQWIAAAGVLGEIPQSATQIALAVHWVDDIKQGNSRHVRNRVEAALMGREGVDRHISGVGKGSRVTYSLAVNQMAAA